MSHSVLVIGSGGREHAICWKLNQSPQVAQIFALPGSFGISQLSKCQNLGADVLDAKDFEVSAAPPMEAVVATTVPVLHLTFVLGLKLHSDCRQEETETLPTALRMLQLRCKIFNIFIIICKAVF
ncbi:hypothetical protein ACLKA6_017683 [Drosophila palustris]